MFFLYITHYLYNLHSFNNNSDRFHIENIIYYVKKY